MDNREVMSRTEAFVKEVLAGEGTGHDWWHADRVRNTALHLAEQEGADRFVVELAALLHDVGDRKLARKADAREWLMRLGVEEVIIAHICTIINALSFKGAGAATPMETREGMIVQDADRLDALGAIGVARCFATGARLGNVLHDPTVQPVLHGSAEAYRSAKTTSINHFHEKLLLLRDRMNTAAARKMAAERHAFMEQFLGRFSAEWESPALHAADELQRYSRHLVMPEIGAAGQEKIRRASVLVAGAGGLGSPAGLYLAAAGIGTLGIADGDVVDASNLQRQILYGLKDVGRRKAQAAREQLLGISPESDVIAHDTQLSRENAADVLKNYDVVVDGTDNFSTHALLSSACTSLKKPHVYASVMQFEGQLSVFDAERGPCYRCLYPSPPQAQSCADAGVLNALPGILGAVQAAETIKLIAGAGEPLIGRLLVVNALTMEFRTLALGKNPSCPGCSGGRHSFID